MNSAYIHITCFYLLYFTECSSDLGGGGGHTHPCGVSTRTAPSGKMVDGDISAFSAADDSISKPPPASVKTMGRVAAALSVFSTTGMEAGVTFVTKLLTSSHKTLPNSAGADFT